ncbi:putative short-chain dehydrogenase/reductase family protein [Hypoxylon trugodes]|uniref:putative short-chain dehydrogenase/reductase family protein n=1 Tax=Hypoxylon trugodes TaxID=326681 RepID=UPI00218E604C|nr:putative short-chain dehydrogenase/reductase family protein [Hypoxylon trugodes]KAI1383975.1 putative short-chain dehydrogenase/reductase family protein [Hypoxylon trugodes]
MASFFLEFAAEQRLQLPLLVTPETCSGKTYIVTGANTGLGYETSKHLVNCRAKKVIMAVRNLEAGETAKAEIESATNNRGIAEVWSLDLSSFDSVKSFAKRVNSQLDRIDAVIENASVAHDRWSTVEGYEASTTINILSTFLLAVLVLPKLTEVAKRYGNLPHLTIVTSGVAFTAKEAMDRIRDNPLAGMNDPTTTDMNKRYPLTKLFQHYAGRHLATLVPVSKTGVVVNLVNPGLCKTKLSRNSKFSRWLEIYITNLLVGRSQEMGSRPLLHASMAGAESHGRYVSSCEIKEHQVPEWVKGEEGRKLGERIWNDIAVELEKIEPGCLDRVLRH